ncbi:MAG: hypothetical protein COB51_09640 [Moraxellaceae bacterium]|nr:MAG: hypothetical protein COB51_09640 [Moraxellaceae bacterium]
MPQTSNIQSNTTYTKSLKTQQSTPFSHQFLSSPWPQRLDAKLVHSTQSELHLELPFHKRITNHAGFVHGGTIASMLHDAGYLLAQQCLSNPCLENNALQDPEALHVETIDCQIFYLNAAKNTSLKFQAVLLKQSKRLAFIEVNALDHENNLVSKCHCSFGTWEGVERNSHWQRKHLELLDLTPEPHPTKYFWDTMIHKPEKGMHLEQMGSGYCRIKIDPQPRFLDLNDEIAHGALLSIADNVGTLASTTELKAASNGSTIDLSITFCERIKDESIICFGEFTSQKGSQLNSHFFMVGETSHALKAFGTTTMWIKT